MLRYFRLSVLWNLANAKVFDVDCHLDLDQYSVQSCPIFAVLSHPARPAAKCKEIKNIYFTAQNIIPCIKELQNYS